MNNHDELKKEDELFFTNFQRLANAFLTLEKIQESNPNEKYLLLPYFSFSKFLKALASNGLFARGIITVTHQFLERQEKLSPNGVLPVDMQLCWLVEICQRLNLPFTFNDFQKLKDAEPDNIDDGEYIWTIDIQLPDVLQTLSSAWQAVKWSFGHSYTSIITDLTDYRACYEVEVVPKLSEKPCLSWVKLQLPKGKRRFNLSDEEFLPSSAILWLAAHSPESIIKLAEENKFCLLPGFKYSEKDLSFDKERVLSLEYCRYSGEGFGHKLILSPTFIQNSPFESNFSGHFYYVLYQMEKITI